MFKISIKYNIFCFYTKGISYFFKSQIITSQSCEHILKILKLVQQLNETKQICQIIVFFKHALYKICSKLFSWFKFELLTERVKKKRLLSYFLIIFSFTTLL